MKKISYVLMLAAMIAACSSDDNNVESHQIEEGVLKSLKLEASATSVLIGDEVSFSLFDDAGKEVDGAIMLNGKEISKKYVFDKVGVFKVTGAKQGFNTSNEVSITVTEKELAPLTLKASAVEVEVGQKVTFEVKSEDIVVKEGVKIFDVKANKELAGLEFTATQVGDFEFLAKGEGFAESEKVTVKVKEAVVTFGNKLVVNGKELDIDYCTIDYKVIKRGELEDDIVAAVYDLGNGVYGNQYSFIVRTKDNSSAKKGFIFIEMLVPNPTIKMSEDGKVLDYGTRVLPTKDTKIKMKSIYSGIEGFSVYDTPRNIHKYTMDIKRFNFDLYPDNTNKYQGNMEFKFTYESESNFTMDFQFNGDSFIVEYD